MKGRVSVLRVTISQHRVTNNVCVREEKSVACAWCQSVEKTFKMLTPETCGLTETSVHTRRGADVVILLNLSSNSDFKSP